MFLINPYILGGGSALDVDAQSFITAASITDPTQESAVNQLVLDLKSYSIWSKLEAIYPFVGGSASSHSYNLKNTSQFQITWSGGVTHNSNGITGNGTNAYGDTGLNDSIVLTNFISFGVYSRTNITSPAYDMAAINSGFITNRISSRFNASGLYTTSMDGSGTFTSSTDSLGLFCANRTSTTTRQSYIDGVETSHSISSGGYVGENMYILAQNQTGTSVNSYSSRNLAFAFIGNSLTTTEHANLYTAVQAFQTTLSRQV